MFNFKFILSESQQLKEKFFGTSVTLCNFQKPKTFGAATLYLKLFSNATNGMHHPDRENTKYAEQNTKLFTLFCREFTHFIGVQFSNALAYINDKCQVCNFTAHSMCHILPHMCGTPFAPSISTYLAFSKPNQCIALQCAQTSFLIPKT